MNSKIAIAAFVISSFCLAGTVLAQSVDPIARRDATLAHTALGRVDNKVVVAQATADEAKKKIGALKAQIDAKISVERKAREAGYKELADKVSDEIEDLKKQTRHICGAFTGDAAAQAACFSNLESQTRGIVQDQLAFGEHVMLGNVPSKITKTGDVTVTEFASNGGGAARVPMAYKQSYIGGPNGMLVTTELKPANNVAPPTWQGEEITADKAFNSRPLIIGGSTVGGALLGGLGGWNVGSDHTEVTVRPNGERIEDRKDDRTATAVWGALLGGATGFITSYIATK